MLQAYNLKVIETATYTEIYEYLDEPVFYTVGTKENNEKVKHIDSDENNAVNNKIAEKHYDALKRKQKHYEKMRWEIARLVDCNFDNQTKFMTLTFKENIKDLNYTNKEFKKFIQRLNYYLYKDKKHHLKYIAVWEKQKRGAIHYHVIFFSLPYIPVKELRKIWRNGFVKINIIDVDSKDNRGRYVSKYFSKDIDEKDFKQKAFFKSQNLSLPEVKLYFDRPIELDLVEDRIVYSKIYTHKVPKFDIENELYFKNGTVKYTKIRKDDVEHVNGD